MAENILDFTIGFSYYVPKIVQSRNLNEELEHILGKMREDPDFYGNPTEKDILLMTAFVLAYQKRPPNDKSLLGLYKTFRTFLDRGMGPYTIKEINEILKFAPEEYRDMIRRYFISKWEGRYYFDTTYVEKIIGACEELNRKREYKRRPLF